MIDGIPAVIGLSAPLASTLAIFYMVFTGRLIVRSEHLTVVRILESQRDDLRTERDGWKTTANRKGETNVILARTNEKLIETANVTQHVMHALQEGVNERHVGQEAQD